MTPAALRLFRARLEAAAYAAYWLGGWDLFRDVIVCGRGRWN